MKKNVKTAIYKGPGASIQIKSIGPVNNLENHLASDWWRRIFNSMYLKTDADVVEDKKITSSEVDLFASILGMEKNAAILDLACGQGRHLLELGRRKYTNLYGLDRSRYLIQRAKSISQKEGVNITFKEGDARKLPFKNDTFDFVVILGNSFGYFENAEDDIKILKEIFRILKPEGKFLMDVADGEYIKKNYSPRSWEWIDNKLFVNRERSLAKDGERLISREVITHIHKGVVVDQFYAERLYEKQQLLNLLNKVGFSDCTIHGQISSDSERNQDLGMMERRIILHAIVKKAWTRIDKPKQVKNIAVVMGDPSKPDIIKPDLVFDEDDMNTIDRLKSALSEINGCSFTYYNNHSTLINDLVKNKNKIDFILNLCDEGYGNDAKKELHVPAILEMLEIPYTGSNPQCLAYCYDKSLIRGIAKEMKIPVAEAFYIKPEDNIYEMEIAFPVIVKPNFGDSSFGITAENVAYNLEQLNNAITRIRGSFGYDKPILVEEFLTGTELTVGIVGNPPESYTVLPLIEEDYSELPEGLPKICGYEAKWLVDSPYFKALKSVRSELPESTQKLIIDSCLKLCERLECRDYVRFDWRLDAKGNPYLLEVNPNPGWCWDGHLAKMAAISGMSYSQLLNAILDAAETRLGLNQISQPQNLKKEVQSAVTPHLYN